MGTKPNDGDIEKNVGTGYVTVPDSIFAMEFSPKEIVVLVYLLCYVCADGFAYPGQKKMCHDLRINRETLMHLLNKMKSRNVINWHQSRNENNDFSQNHYSVDESIFAIKENSKYGFVAKDVLTNAELPIPAKAIYIYIAAKAGAFYSASLKKEQLASVMQSTPATTNKYLRYLKEYGIVEEKKDIFATTEYILLIRPTITKSRNDLAANKPSTRKPSTRKPSASKEPTSKESTSKPSTNSMIVNNYDNNNNDSDYNDTSSILDEDDLTLEQLVFDTLVDKGEIPVSYLDDREKLMAALHVVTDGMYLDSGVVELVIDGLFGILTADQEIDNRDLLAKLNRKLIYNSGTNWVPTYYMGDFASKFKRKMDDDEITSPISYVKSALYQSLKYS